MTFSIKSGIVAVVGIAIAASLFIVWSRSQPQPSSRQEMIHEKGASVMPFDLNKTLHTFAKNDSGGVQTVVVRDASDTSDLSLIRMHLQMEVQNFSVGNFTDPTQLHGADMPGVSTLTQNFKKMTVAYRELPNGAAIDFQSTDADTIVAIHAWFDAQLSDHGSDAASQ